MPGSAIINILGSDSQTWKVDREIQEYNNSALFNSLIFKDNPNNKNSNNITSLEEFN
jgi:hypothetical protein